MRCPISSPLNRLPVHPTHPIFAPIHTYRPLPQPLPVPVTPFPYLSCSSLQFLPFHLVFGRCVSLLVQCRLRLGVHRHLVTSNSTVYQDREFALGGAKSDPLSFSLVAL